MKELEREGGACVHCGIIMRYRALVHELSLRLFGASQPIGSFPRGAKRLTGIGMSDPEPLAGLLGAALGYTNTFFHKEPRLDIQAPDRAFLDACDFVVSSDVFEHVAPPVSSAFTNARSLLRRGGVLVLSVPFVVDGETAEHFPNLHEYQLQRRGDRFVLLNRTREGIEEVHEDLCFHGGPGETLEMRLFSKSSLERDLIAADFSDVRFHQEPCFDFGIVWKHPWSVPVTAIAA